MKEKTIYALGFFDGVHLGHQALLSECRRLAQTRNCNATAVTFDITPGAVLQGQQPNMILTAKDRAALLSRYGMDRVCVLPATAENLRLSWRAYLDQLMANGAEGFVCGEDYRFGHKGEGTAKLLQAFAAEQSLPCIVVPLQEMDGEKISSTRIRRLLEQGNVADANRLLGHPHILSGTVIQGKQLGRTLGIPTANLSLPETLLTPALGAYACYAYVDGAQYMAVVNVGKQPTVNGQNITVEAWLLDFDGDLYEKNLTLEFYAYLRPEKKFPTLQALQAEIQRNRQQTIDFFGKK